MVAEAGLILRYCRTGAELHAARTKIQTSKTSAKKLDFLNVNLLKALHHLLDRKGKA
jgi:hypothetical protein